MTPEEIAKAAIDYQEATVKENGFSEHQPYDFNQLKLYCRKDFAAGLLYAASQLSEANKKINSLTSELAAMELSDEDEISHYEKKLTEANKEMQELHLQAAELRSLKQSIIESGLTGICAKENASFHDKVVFGIGKLFDNEKEWINETVKREKEIEKWQEQATNWATQAVEYTKEIERLKALVMSSELKVESQQQEIERLKALNDDVISVLNECIEWFEYMGYNPDEYYAAKKFIQSLITPK